MKKRHAQSRGNACPSRVSPAWRSLCPRTARPGRRHTGNIIMYSAPRRCLRRLFSISDRGRPSWSATTLARIARLLSRPCASGSRHGARPRSSWRLRTFRTVRRAFRRDGGGALWRAPASRSRQTAMRLCMSLASSVYCRAPRRQTCASPGVAAAERVCQVICIPL